MKRVFLSILIAAMAILAGLLTPVYAANTPQSYLPLSCERSKGNYKPMTTLVIVPLADELVVQPGASAEEVAKSLFFDLAYVRGNNVAPLNAISHNGEIAYLSCDYPDYLANVVTAGDTGYFILGISGQLPVKMVQDLINKLKISTLLQGELVTIADEKNTTIALANTKPCTENCAGLIPNKEGLGKREFKLTVQEPSYSKSVRQKELVSFLVKVKNEGEFPIYPTGNEALLLAPTSSKLSSLYHSSWISPQIIARVPGMILPGEENAISVTLGAPLLPGKYNESLVLKIGNTRIGKPMSLSFTVENDNYKLGIIVSKDGSAFANLRTTASLTGPIAGRLDVGTYVIIRGIEGAWVRIETKEGRVGWVYKPFIRQL